MGDINLLATEFKPKGSVLKASNVLKKVALVGYVVFFTSGIASTGFIFVLKNKIKTSISYQDKLKTQIKALEQTEQKLVLVKDRLEKVGKVMAMSQVKEEISGVENIVNEIPEGVTMLNTNLTSGKIDMELSAANSYLLGEFLDVLRSQKGYQRIEIGSIVYSKETFYKVKVTLFK
jgi:Tfp pilus assembly protein PilN